MLTLPVTRSKVELKPFIPHGVFAKVQEIAFRGVKIDVRAAQATKEELLVEFGEEEIKALEELAAAEYEKRLSELRQEFLRRRIRIDGLSLSMTEEANVARVEGMVVSVDGKKPETIKGWANDLPEPDFQALLEAINEIERATDSKKNLAVGGADDSGAR